MRKRTKNTFHFGELWGLAIICIGIFLFLSLFSYKPNDVSYYLSPPNNPALNLMGPVGAWSAFILFFVMGLSAYIVPLFSILWGVFKLRKLPFDRRPDIYIFASCLALVSVCSLLSLLNGNLEIAKELKLISPGGLIGAVIGQRLAVKYFGVTGTALIMSAICIISFVYLTELRIWLLIKWLFSGLIACFKYTWNLIKLISVKTAAATRSLIQQIKDRKKAAPVIKSAAPLSKKKVLSKIFPEKKEQRPMSAPTVSRFDDKLIQKETPLKAISPKEPALKNISTNKYVLPPIDLLEPPLVINQRDSKENLTQNAKTLEDAFKEFGITVNVTSIQRGPVVTLYELSLAPGTKIGKITALSDDVALAMRVGGVRIIAPLPGKAAVGIEVPNTKPRFVYLKEVVSTSEFLDPEFKIPLALGMDVAGNPLVSDLSQMPHLLVAGTTGSGKTVCLNTIILSILMRRTPEEVRFLMIDPKMVELAVYKNIPHLLVPVIHNPKKASLGLIWVVREMERRYELFARVGVRNIEGYNKRPGSKNQEKELPNMDEGLLEINYEENPPAKLPYIVIVIDELADLMMVAPADIETAIARLAQLSRAVGIHIILATQRPSVDVLTGVIKANFSTRISFQVASRIDSRTVMDSSGADMLLGKGDMLFMPPGTSKLTRAQCTLVRDREISKIVDFIVSQKKANFGSKQAKEVVFQKLQEAHKSSEEEDPLFNDAVDVFLANQQASVSLLQRKLKIGYNRSARIVDMMEERGILGPLDNGKREILINRDELVSENT